MTRQMIVATHGVGDVLAIGPAWDLDLPPALVFEVTLGGVRRMVTDPVEVIRLRFRYPDIDVRVSPVLRRAPGHGVGGRGAGGKTVS